MAVKPNVVHPVSKEQLPVVFGHEFGGVVTEVGEGVTRASVGDLVAIRPSLYDGTCIACTAGCTNVCHNVGFLGLQGSGGLAEYAVIEQKLVFRMPKGSTQELAALVEPLAVGWHATSLVPGLDPSSTVLILGGGPIGCAIFLALTAQGLKNIVVSEILEARRDLLKTLGASHVFSPQDTDIAEKVRELFGSWGADAAFDCAGLTVTLKTAGQALRPQGTVVNVALRGGASPVNLDQYIMKEVVLKNSNSYTDQDFESVINALGSGIMKPEAMVSRKITLEDVVDHGIKVLAQPNQKDCKILVEVQSST